MRYDRLMSLNNVNAITSDKKNIAKDSIKPRLMTKNRIEKNPCFIVAGSFSAARNRIIVWESPRRAIDDNNVIVVVIRAQIP